MNIFGFEITKIKKKQHDTSSMHELSEIDRELSLEKRRTNAELRRIQEETRKINEIKKLEQAKAELQELRDSLYQDEYEDDEPEEDNLINSLLMRALNPQGVDLSIQNNPDIPQKLNFTSDEMRIIIDRIPKGQKKRICKLADEEIFNLIKTQYPNISEQSAREGLEILKKSV